MFDAMQCYFLANLILLGVNSDKLLMLPLQCQLGYLLSTQKGKQHRCMEKCFCFCCLKIITWTQNVHEKGLYLSAVPSPCQHHHNVSSVSTFSFVVFFYLNWLIITANWYWICPTERLCFKVGSLCLFLSPSSFLLYSHLLFLHCRRCRSLLLPGVYCCRVRLPNCHLALTFTSLHFVKRQTESENTRTQIENSLCSNYHFRLW